MSDARPAPTLPLYVGAFLGPFGAGVLPVVIPQLRDAFDATTAEVALGVPAYLVPFAILQLVSGTLGERFGRRRAVRVAYLVYAVSSAAAAFAPGIGLFLVARALSGTANAFVTPLLLASLADVTPRAIGRAVGTFAAVQTGAAALAPLLGGALGEIGWRLVFLAPTAAALALALIPPPPSPRLHTPGNPVRLRSVVNLRIGLMSGAAFAAYCGTVGAIFLVALRAADEFGLSSTERGLALAGFGLAGMLLGRAAGDAVDRFDRVPVIVTGTALAAAAVAGIGLAPGALSAAALWTLAGAGSALIWAGLNTLTVEAVPENRAGGTSVVGAFKFAGSAVGPLLWLPLYHVDPWLGFAAAGATTALVVAFVVPLATPGSARPRLSGTTPGETG
jgi:MFS family permease